MNTDYIYLLQEREFITSKQNIYKIGKTKQNNLNRFSQYPKGSILLFQIICNDCNITEKILIKLFDSKYIKRTDIGNEYFQGNFKNMISDIFYQINSDNNNDDNDNDDNNNNEKNNNNNNNNYNNYNNYNKPSYKDMIFKNIHLFANTRISTKKIYDKYIEYSFEYTIKYNKYYTSSYISFGKYIKTIFKKYYVKSSNSYYSFPDNVTLQQILYEYDHDFFDFINNN